MDEAEARIKGTRNNDSKRLSSSSDQTAQVYELQKFWRVDGKIPASTQEKNSSLKCLYLSVCLVCVGVSVCEWVCVRACAIDSMWRAEDKLEEFSFYYVSPGN